ncbi:MAG TPA: TonB-dependent receptor [Longimicrobiales bacterium]
MGGLVALALMLVPGPAAAQERGAAASERAGTVRGVVRAAEGGAPLAGARVYIDRTNLGATTDARGAFRIAGIEPGIRVLVAERIGHRTERLEIRVEAGRTVEVELRLPEEAVRLPDLVVSTTREAERLSSTAATVGVVDGAALRDRHAAHPSQALSGIPGVWVNVTGGEGHMTAIRQPLTTDPVYLYLEDGVPTRSTGFFNHNALYEVNLPQAARIEVVKGPATALYGSDALGGVVNVQTRPAVAAPGVEATLEGGGWIGDVAPGFGWSRFLGSGAFVAGGNGVRLDLNVTHSAGWREGTDYDRRSATLRWDRDLAGDAQLKTVVAWSRIDQGTAGASRLAEADYDARPTRNLTPISFREVDALRVSVAYERRTATSLLDITPFARYNAMDMLPNWSLSYDPALSRTANRSLGLLVKYRRDFDRLDARLIAGVDVDWSPGEHFERAVAPLRVDGVFTDYTPGAVIYDYDVAFLGISPYLHAEASPLPRLRLTAGLRFDRIGYDYENRLGALDTGRHRRPASTAIRYTELSPKLGVALDLGAGASIYAAYGHGFRAPSESQLFRQGVAENTVGLEPVKADNIEVGARGALGDRLRWELAAYRMTKADDIVTYRRSDDNRETRNAGATLHRGIEAGLAVALAEGLRAEAAWSYARHTYEAWRPDPATDYAGHEIESAPRTIGSVSLRYAPAFLDGASAAFEWKHLGAYWLDAANTERYDGHDLLNLRASYEVRPGATLYVRVDNVTDARYAESAGYSTFLGREFAPGLPRTLYAGLQLAFRRMP